MNKYIIKELYLLDKETEILGVVSISSLDGIVTFVPIKKIAKDSNDFKSYFNDDLSNLNEKDQEWYWTKNLLDYMDFMMDKNSLLLDINSIDEIDINKDIRLYSINKQLIDNDKMIYRQEITDDDLLELTVKLLEKNKTDKFLTAKLEEDIIDSKNWMLDTIMDNG